MSYVRIVDIEISKEDALYKLNDVLERRINAVLSSEYPINAQCVKILSTEDSSIFNTVTYKVLILFG